MSHRFTSTAHPDRVRYAVLLRERGTRMFSVLMIPVMIWALVEALSEGAPLRWFITGSIVAGWISAAYVHFTARTRIAEIVVARSSVALRSLAQVSSSASVPYLPLIEARRASERLVLAIGSEQVELHLGEWPESKELVAAIQAALDADMPLPEGALTSRS